MTNRPWVPKVGEWVLVRCQVDEVQGDQACLDDGGWVSIRELRPADEPNGHQAPGDHSGQAGEDVAQAGANDEPSVDHDAYRAAIQTLAELTEHLPPDELESLGKYQAAQHIEDAEAHVERYNADPAARPSVDEMVEALCKGAPWGHVVICADGDSMCVEIDKTMHGDDGIRVFYGPTPTAAIRAAFEAVTK